MDQLIERLVVDIGVDHAAAKQAVAIILNFAREKAGADVVGQTAAAISGLSQLI
jgi:hypothetical protein